MSFPVFLTDDAARDLEDLYDYIELHDVPGKADHVLEQIEKAFTSLSENPQRGAYPKELLTIGLREYREIFFKPYRIIYRVMAENVYVLADRRRASGHAGAAAATPAEGVSPCSHRYMKLGFPVWFFHVYRVAGGCFQPQAPLEPCMRLSPHTARASRKAAPVRQPG